MELMAKVSEVVARMEVEIEVVAMAKPEEEGEESMELVEVWTNDLAECELTAWVDVPLEGLIEASSYTKKCVEACFDKVHYTSSNLGFDTYSNLNQGSVYIYVACMVPWALIKGVV